MKKVFNLRIECNAPTFVMTDEEFCKGLEEVIADEFGEEMKYVKLKAEPCDKDQQLAIYKRALELACHYMEYEYPKKNDDIYYRKERELEMIFLNKAKEELGEQKCVK